MSSINIHTPSYRPPQDTTCAADGRDAEAGGQSAAASPTPSEDLAATPAVCDEVLPDRLSEWDPLALRGAAARRPRRSVDQPLSMTTVPATASTEDQTLPAALEYLAPTRAGLTLHGLAEDYNLRHHMQNELTRMLLPQGDLRAAFKRGLVAEFGAAFARAAGRGFNPDRLYLNQFDVWGPLWSSPLAEGQYQRKRLRQSWTLTDAAIRIASDPENGIPDSVDYGVYLRNTNLPRQYTPADAVPGIDLSTFIARVRNADWLRVYRQGWDSVIKSFDVDPDGHSSLLIQKHLWVIRTSLNLEALAGRIGRQATALMRTVLTLPSASQRQESDGGVDGVDVYRIGVSVPGQTELLYPAGMFVVSQRAGARSVLFTPGGAVPFRDYATLHALVGDLARDGTSSARRHLLECLPLRHRAAASAEGARIVLTIERENILSVVTRTNCAVIQDDLAFSAEAVAEGAREQRWLSWFTAVPFETSARVPGADAAFIGFSGGVPPDLPPRQECVRFDDRAVEQLRHLNQMRADIVAAAPSVREVATQYVASLMQAHVGKHVDVERIGLSLLLIDRSPESDVQSHKEIVIPLPAVVMIRLEEGGLPLNALSRARFQLPPGKDGKPDDLAGLTPGALFRRIDVVQYRETLRRRFDAFLSEQSRQIREVLKGSYIVEANTGAFARRLGAPAMAMALAVANVEPSAPLELSGLARTDIDAPQHVRVAWLSLNGYRSDILTLTDRNTGVVVFYDAWSRGPRFKEFPDWDAAQRWCHDQVSSEEKRIRLESAFSLRRGTESAMDFSAYIRGTQITDDAGVWQIRPDRVDIDGDVFDAIFNTFRRRLTGAFEVSAAEEIHPLGGFQKVLLALNLAIGAASFFMAPLSQAAIGLAAFQLALGGALALFADTPAEKSVAANFAVGGLVGGSVSLSALIARNVSAMGGLNAFRSSTSSSDMAPALPGLYHHDSRLYAQVRDHVYGVAYDTDVRSWRMVDQATQLASGPLLELGGDFEWYLSEIQSPVEAQSSWGGNVLPDPATVVVGAKFESKATALRTASNQLKRDAFLDGVQAGKQIALPSPQTRRASGLLQLDFLDPATTDPRELGMLYQRFVATRAAELAEKAVVAANLLRADVALLGGQFLPLPQAPYLASVGAQRGFCLPLCRAMAVALYRRKTADWVRTLDAAITAPQTERAMALKADLIALHSHAGIAAAQESVGLREFSEVTDMISALSSPNQMFLMSTVEHSMLFGTCLDRTGALNYFFYDPNFGVISHRHADVLSQLMEDHLIGRQMATQYGAYMIGNACGFEVRALRLDTLANASLCSTTVGGLIKVKAAPAVLAGQGSRAAV